MFQKPTLDCITVFHVQYHGVQSMDSWGLSPRTMDQREMMTHWLGKHVYQKDEILILNHLILIICTIMTSLLCMTYSPSSYKFWFLLIVQLMGLIPFWIDFIWGFSPNLIRSHYVLILSIHLLITGLWFIFKLGWNFRFQERIDPIPRLPSSEASPDSQDESPRRVSKQLEKLRCCLKRHANLGLEGRDSWDWSSW